MSMQDIVKQMLSAVPPGITFDHATGVAEAYLASLRHKDPIARGALFAENVTFEDPVGSRVLRGKAELQKFWQSFDTAPIEMDPRLDRVIVSGNEALMIFHMKTSLPGMGAVEIEIFETLRFDADGKIAEGRAFWDERCVK